MAEIAASIPQRYLRTQEAARFLGLSERTLEKHRTYGTGPTYRKLGGRVVYRLEDVEEYEREQIRASTADHPSKPAA